MGIFGWDLPPGCSISDIPGNRPEDAEWERIYDNFWDKKRLTEAHGIRVSEKEYEQMDKLWKSKSKVNRVFVDLLDTYIMSAIEYGLELGETKEKQYVKEVDAEERYYHREHRNPILIAFFKKQRQLLKQVRR